MAPKNDHASPAGTGRRPLRRRGIPKINLMGWSWGATIMGAYTAEQNGKVAALVLYSPGWLKRPPPSQAAATPLGACISQTMAQARERILTGRQQTGKTV
ncbi:MAG: alpha/beta fold hydrolase [Acidimicrobiales bacterium]